MAGLSCFHAPERWNRDVRTASNPTVRPGRLICLFLRRSRSVIDLIGMVQRSRDLILGEIGAVVAVDRERYPAAAVHVTRPAECFIERGEFLEQELVLLQRRDRLGAARADINTIAHGVAPFALKQKGSPALQPRLPVRAKNIVAKWADRKALSAH